MATPYDVPGRDDIEARVASILAHGRVIAASLPEELRHGDPTDHLYDERGLPA
ncbi:MAG: hypothetical protein Q8R60_01495 [Mycobacteriales bacterium]|nr:hypothetical protein [Mycobacteriales bacterium]